MGGATTITSANSSRILLLFSETRSEHVKAVAWLNESTSTDFYLIKLEAIKIGDSLPAPLFTTIVEPSEEAREIGQTKKEIKERHVVRKQFWKRLLEHSANRTHLHANITPGRYNWIGTGAGKTGMSFNYNISRNEGRAELYIDRGKDAGELNEAIFSELYAQKDEIESMFEGSLSWERLENKRACRIAKYVNIGGYGDEEKWDAIIEEMVDSMIRLERSLSDPIKALQVV